jgi:hypothetical protein
MGVSSITIADFKAFFIRDFVYYSAPGCPKEAVTDTDLTRCFLEASINFNESLFPNQDQLKVAYLYLAAHYLCVDTQVAAQGVNSVGYAPVSARTVGQITESYHNPDWLMRDPVLSMYVTTRYGLEYLSIIRPLLIGNAVVYQGATTP